VTDTHALMTLPAAIAVPTYDLPEDAIAQRPVEPRDAARLLDALDPARPPAHRHVRDLPELVGPGDVLVVNTSRVRPARLHLRKASGGAAEVLLLEALPGVGDRWVALVRPGRRLPPGTVLHAAAGGPDLHAATGGPADAAPVIEVGERLGDGRRQVRVLDAGLAERLGEVPLPPYIHEPLADPGRYQTVYADRPGSVAAPTAGLHLTTEVIERCRARGAVVAPVDLEVGLGTFRPVAGDDLAGHVMHVERYRVPEATWAACQAAARTIAIGTTSVRALETAAATGELAGASDLFIHGDHRFAVVDVLFTNFHQPRSTLLALLEAFCGPRWRDLYREALAGGYRFLSFGDAMVVGRRPGAAATDPPTRR
jgi:S-adenosylmethionine:tRNA ribosyltransferase-isomerase